MRTLFPKVYLRGGLRRLSSAVQTPVIATPLEVMREVNRRLGFADCTRFLQRNAISHETIGTVIKDACAPFGNLLFDCSDDENNLVLLFRLNYCGTNALLYRRAEEITVDALTINELNIKNRHLANLILKKHPALILPEDEVYATEENTLASPSCCK